MVTDVRSGYFAAPEEIFMPGEGAMMPSFSAFPQATFQPSAFEAMPAYTPPTAQPMTQQPVAPYDMGGYDFGNYDFGGFGGYAEPAYQQPAYQQPAYQPPAYGPAAYQQPAYDPYAYQQPAYEPAAYQQPAYEPSAYEPAAYQQPAYQTMPAVQPMTQRAVSPYDMGDFSGGYNVGQYAEPYQPMPTAQPMTQQAVAPYDTGALSNLDLSGLNSLYGMNFGSDFGGGAMGGQYQPDPNLQYIAAPLSNKGNATSQTGGNAFAVRADQPVRLVDHRTNQVVFEGSGFDAARKATELGQSLTDEFGRKATYSIQTADPAGNYSTVAYEKPNKSTLGQVANVAGTLLPIAALAIPGLGPALFGMSQAAFAASIPARIALGAGLGALGSGLKGDNILKGAALGGLGAAGGAVLGGPIGNIGASNLGLKAGTAIGTGLGTTAGGLVTGQSLKNALLSGVASGALNYAAPGIQKSLGIGQGPSLSTDTGGSVDPNVMATVTGYRPAPSLGLNFGNSLSDARPTPPKLQDPYDGLRVTGGKFSTLSGGDVGNVFGAPNSGLPSLERLQELLTPEELEKINVIGGKTFTSPSTLNVSPDVAAGLAEFERNPIVAEAMKTEQPVAVDLSPDVAAGLAEFERNPIVAEASKLQRPEETFAPINLDPPDAMYGMKEPIVVTGGGKFNPVSVTPDLGLGGGSGVGPLPVPKMDPELTDKDKNDDKLGVKDYLRLAGLASGLLGAAAGGRGSSGSKSPAGQNLQNVFSARLPRASGIFSAKNLAPRDMSGTDWNRYGFGPEKAFFQNVPTSPAERTALVNAYKPSNLPLSAVGGMPLGTTTAPGDVPLTGIEDVLRNMLPDATDADIAAFLATPEGQQAVAQLLSANGSTGYAKGGKLSAKRRAPRESFAVQGPGTGRSDDIPAVLSDGEYVIDAETVALLGDGSSKAGAKKLDEMRVKVRKHKGRNLAKGKFSVNAKQPEKYLSGGRT